MNYLYYHILTELYLVTTKVKTTDKTNGHLLLFH